MSDYQFKKGDIAHHPALGDFLVQHQNYDGYVFKNNRNYAPREQVTLVASAEDIKRWKKFYREQNNEMP